MIHTQGLRVAALEAIKKSLAEEAEYVALSSRTWTVIKNIASDGEKIASAIVGEQLSDEVEGLIVEWVDASILHDEAIAAMDQMLREMEAQVIEDGGDPDTCWSDIVEAVAINFEADEARAEWLRTTGVDLSLRLS